MLSPSSLADDTSVSIADEMSVSIADEMSVSIADEMSVSLADETSARTRFRLGAGPACGSTPVLRHVGRTVVLPTGGESKGTAMPLARPWARSAAVGLGYDAQAAGQAELARQQRTSKVNYAHLTRTAIKGGGYSGPHPGRDPV
jgi:hypothetical protein